MYHFVWNLKQNLQNVFFHVFSLKVMPTWGIIAGTLIQTIGWPEFEDTIGLNMLDFIKCTLYPVSISELTTNQKLGSNTGCIFWLF